MLGFFDAVIRWIAWGILFVLSLIGAIVVGQCALNWFGKGKF